MSKPSPDQGNPDAKGGRRASRKAKRAERAAAANERLTASLQALHATQRATGLQPADADTTGGGAKLTGGQRLAAGLTSLLVMGVVTVGCIVIVATQVGFYVKQLGAFRYVDLFGARLDLATFTPLATEGIVWACTCMAVVLTMFNRTSGPWTRAMWLFASIAAVVNTWHAAAMGDVLGAVIKGGLSLAVPFVAHLFIYWVRHLYYGTTVTEHKELAGMRWAAIGRAVRTVLRTIAAHVLHPRIAFGALSTYVALRTLSYNHAWFINAAKYRSKLRQPAPTDDDPEPAPRADVVAVLGTQADDDRAVRALLAAYEEELSDIDPNLPTAGDTDPDATGSTPGGGAGSTPTGPAGSTPGATLTGFTPPEGPVSGLTSMEPDEPEGGTTPWNRDGNQGATRAGTGRNPSANQGGTGQQPHRVEPVKPAAGTSTPNPVEPGDGPSDTERIVQRLWADHHAGMQTSNADLAAQLDVKPGTVKSVRFRWKQGRYPDPYTNN